MVLDVIDIAVLCMCLKYVDISANTEQIIADKMKNIDILAYIYVGRECLLVRVKSC